MRLLIIENSERLAGLLVDGLVERGFVCDTVLTLASADDALAVSEYDALVLDLGLPDGDGLEWLGAARLNSRITVPALILTARGALGDRIAGLDAGADDYVVKPIDIDELSARLRALLRRPGPRAPIQLSSGSLCFDTVSRNATCEGKPLDLSRRESALLELLIRREGVVVQRSTIEDALYNFNDPVTPNAIEAVVSRLRRKLEVVGEGRRLHTIRGVGYMLTA